MMEIQTDILATLRTQEAALLALLEREIELAQSRSVVEKERRLTGFGETLEIDGAGAAMVGCKLTSSTRKTVSIEASVLP